MLTTAEVSDFDGSAWLEELGRIQRFRNTLDVYEAWAIAHADRAGAAAVAGERAMGDAMRRRLGISGREARRRNRTSKAAGDHEKIREGMADGDINSEQATDLAEADISSQTRDRLTDEARDDSADETRRKTSQAQREHRANNGEDPLDGQRKRRSGQRFIDREGMWNLRLRTDSETGAQLDAAIGAIHKGLWHTDKTTHGERSPQQRYADAITQALLRGADSERTEGGSAAPIRPELTITVGLEWLRDRSKQFDPTYGSNGVAFTAAALRRLACDATILPAVLGTDSELLDLGRTKRTVSKAQRSALRLRDQRCVWPGCDVTPDMCDAHHARHWIWGGPTDLANLVLLCHTHHRLCHEGGYEMWADTRRGGWNIHDSAGIPRHHTANTRTRAGPEPRGEPGQDSQSQLFEPTGSGQIGMIDEVA